MSPLVLLTFLSYFINFCFSNSRIRMFINKLLFCSFDILIQLFIIFLVNSDQMILIMTVLKLFASINNIYFMDFVETFIICIVLHNSTILSECSKIFSTNRNLIYSFYVVTSTIFCRTR